MLSRTRALSAAILAASVAAGSASTQAAIVVFELGDHPNGVLYQSDPSSPYGLRLDGQGSTFSAGTNLGGLGGPITLTYDDADASVDAVISGTLERNDDGTFWTVSYTITGLTLDGNGGFTATSATGSINEIGGAMRSANLVGKTNGAGEAFIFANDGHRLPGSTGWVGRGWIMDSGTNDWLVTAAPVPVPAAAWLFGSAVAALVGVRRKTQ